MIRRKSGTQACRVWAREIHETNYRNRKYSNKKKQTKQNVFSPIQREDPLPLVEGFLGDRHIWAPIPS